MTLKSVARPGAAVIATVLAACALTACSAGQVSQTAHQVAAVDGASGGTADKKLLVRDVTVVVQENDPMAVVKFTAINNDTDMKTYTLKSVSVDGENAKLTASPELTRNCLLVSDTDVELSHMKAPKDSCIEYTTASVKNPGFPTGGNVPVIFSFDDGTDVAVDATVVDPLLAAGQVDRNYGQDAGKDSHAKH